ncbi:hypothetical protein [Aquimarina agarilytica]|uniref:hypothetical protein n=1 Tax=Aquimarina agarilytica TaxID=1087449 RepID=UPI000287E47B|nr:hypothetical protein [Aquimarina agarilytica]
MNKYTILLISLLLDGVGMLSYLFPGIGEATDIVWAPVSGWLMIKLYKGKEGKIAGIITLIEEGIPGIDVIPTFTLMWIYTYIITGKAQKV